MSGQLWKKTTYYRARQTTRGRRRQRPCSCIRVSVAGQRQQMTGHWNLGCGGGGLGPCFHGTNWEPNGCPISNCFPSTVSCEWNKKKTRKRWKRGDWDDRHIPSPHPKIDTVPHAIDGADGQKSDGRRGGHQHAGNMARHVGHRPFFLYCFGGLVFCLDCPIVTAQFVWLITMCTQFSMPTATCARKKEENKIKRQAHVNYIKKIKIKCRCQSKKKCQILNQSHAK